ncbi:HFL257Wp [Eremothecium sinecaudum]|uniref:HFL257Wp n=1 Tax=Eremothecium sinecaudum TaxID=45286 RepID=A0A0X8HU89_9SACH|nr:HFL257Wp [Eremothecium sinecaudum]AMD21599.1 HFL257Wp [Eremothecium sinecaudum]
MKDKVLISIAGSRSIGVYKTGLKIKERLSLLFPYDIIVLDLDSMTKSKVKSYSNEDYDFQTIIETISAPSNKLQIVLLCGSYALYNKDINDAARVKVFLDSECDNRLINLIKTTGVKDKNDLSLILSQYLDVLRPEYLGYIQPTKAVADIIIPSTNESIGTDIIIDGIVKAVEDIQGTRTVKQHGKKLFPQLDFQLERMDLEKERYYDLS